jgi:uncharacterized membrane protein
MKKRGSKSFFNTLFDFGVIIKGIDGSVEFLTGLVLLVSPTLIHNFLAALSGEAAYSHSQFILFAGQYIAKLDNDLAANGLTFLTIFLLTHGAIKIILVYCLLKRIVKAYPLALAVLLIFLIYQLYVLVGDPSIAMVILCLLDAVIIGLVWREYRVLLSKKVI